MKTRESLGRFYSDGHIESAGFMASWKVIDAPDDDDDEEEEEEEETSSSGSVTQTPSKRQGYLLTFPQSFTTSAETTPEDVCLQVMTW